MLLLKRFTFLILFLSQMVSVNAQTGTSNTTNYDALSLEELMNIKITVASIKELTPRQSPGIITYITLEDIRNSGARDLMEVLKLVPGFEFGVDVDGVVGIAVRGNWAHEGKVVLFIDGIEMNEALYSTLQFGNHYPVDNIERIEIIRGPGSALHGGFAAYAVINIITRTTLQGNTEVASQASQSLTSEGLARTSGSIYLGKKGEKGGFAFHLTGTNTQRSHGNYSDVYGDGYDMQSNSDLKNIFLNASGNIGNLYLRVLSDNYSVQSMDNYVELAEKPGNYFFRSHSVEAKYEWKTNDKLKIIPRFVLTKQYPWSTSKKKIETDEFPFRVNTLSMLGSINATYELSEKINITSGVSIKRESSTNELEGETFNTTGTNEFINQNIAIFTQALYNTGWFNVVGGIRFNNNNRYDDAFVPRIGITREFKKLHLKALYSRAFRAPSIQNIDIGINIQPEYTNVIEFEGGFQISKDAYFTLNAFHMQTEKPIVYFVDPSDNSDAYANLSKTGTDGVEFVFQYKKKWGGFDVNGSYYQSQDGTDLLIYQVPGQDQIHLGLATYKANCIFRIMLSPTLQFGTNITWLSSRYGINRVDANDETPNYKKYPNFNLLNAHLEYRFKKTKGLTARLSVRNILDEKEIFIQPFNSHHAPLPGMQREVQLKITYQNF